MATPGGAAGGRGGEGFRRPPWLLPAAVALRARAFRQRWPRVVSRLLLRAGRRCGKLHGAVRRREVRPGQAGQGTQLGAMEKMTRVPGCADAQRSAAVACARWMRAFDFMPR